VDIYPHVNLRNFIAFQFSKFLPANQKSLLWKRLSAFFQKQKPKKSECGIASFGDCSYSVHITVFDFNKLKRVVKPQIETNTPNDKNR